MKTSETMEHLCPTWRCPWRKFTVFPLRNFRATVVVGPSAEVRGLRRDVNPDGVALGGPESSLYRKNHRKTIGKWENHRKTIGTWRFSLL